MPHYTFRIALLCAAGAAAVALALSLLALEL